MTIDHIKLFKSINPYDFGIISYLHSQNDILSAGGSVHSLSVSIGVPFSENLVESFYLEYFMRGVQIKASKDDAYLAAGHSYQTEEPAVTITMNGSIKQKSKKYLANKGNLIYLSKPLGTGYLLAAYFQNSKLLSISDFEKLLRYLKKSNDSAAKSGFSYGSQLMTDISGFGLASHLGDVCQSSNLSAQIQLNKDILINDKLEILKNFESSGYKNNYLSSFGLIGIKDDHPLLKIVFDPQTNGPLLIAIDKEKKNEFENNFEKNYFAKPILIGENVKSEAGITADPKQPEQWLMHLLDRNMYHILVEGGASILEFFIDNGLADEVHRYTSSLSVLDGVTGPTYKWFDSSNRLGEDRYDRN